MSLSLEDTVVLVEAVTKQLSSGNYDRSIRSSIVNMSSNVKRLGPQLETHHKERLDALQGGLRTACRDENLDLVSRVHLLELIELRAMSWLPNENVTNYYKQKLALIEAEVGETEPSQPATAPAQLNPHAPNFRSVISPSPTATLPIFRTATVPQPLAPRPSTPPVIQLQPPPAPRRANSVTPNGDQKPPPGPAVHQVTVTTGDDTVTVTGASLSLVRTAKLVLEEYFSLEGPRVTGPIEDDDEDEERVVTSDTRPKVGVIRPPLFPTASRAAFAEAETDSAGSSSRRANFAKTAEMNGAKPEITYNRHELLELAASPLCRAPPPDWQSVLNSVPCVVKARPQKVMAGGPARQLIERAVDELAKQEAAKAV